MESFDSHLAGLAERNFRQHLRVSGFKLKEMDASKCFEGIKEFFQSHSMGAELDRSDEGLYFWAAHIYGKGYSIAFEYLYRPKTQKIDNTAYRLRIEAVFPAHKTMYGVGGSGLYFVKDFDISPSVTYWGADAPLKIQEYLYNSKLFRRMHKQEPRFCRISKEPFYGSWYN